MRVGGSVILNGGEKKKRRAWAWGMGTELALDRGGVEKKKEKKIHFGVKCFLEFWGEYWEWKRETGFECLFIYFLGKSKLTAAAAAAAAVAACYIYYFNGIV